MFSPVTINTQPKESSRDKFIFFKESQPDSKSLSKATLNEEVPTIKPGFGEVYIKIEDPKLKNLKDGLLSPSSEEKDIVKA